VKQTSKKSGIQRNKHFNEDTHKDTEVKEARDRNMKQTIVAEKTNKQINKLTDKKKRIRQTNTTHIKLTKKSVC